MRSLVFEGKTWEAYEDLRQQDKKLHKTLCKHLKEMLRGDPSRGMGKPEQLCHNLTGFWSRRISQKDRLVYKFDDQSIYIFAIGGHYDDQWFYAALTFKLTGRAVGLSALLKREANILLLTAITFNGQTKFLNFFFTFFFINLLQTSTTYKNS